MARLEDDALSGEVVHSTFQTRGDVEAMACFCVLMDNYRMGTWSVGLVQMKCNEKFNS